MKRIVTFLCLLCSLTTGLTELIAQTETGYASYYADRFHGRPTAHGEVYNRNSYTCAHKHHPLGTLLKVSRTDNNQSVIVRVNDRGPFIPGRIVDLSYVAAEAIDMVRLGKVMVRAEVVGFSTANPTPTAALAEAPVTSTAAKTAVESTEQPDPYNYRRNTPATEEPASYSTNRKSPGPGTAAATTNSQPLGQYGVQMASFSQQANADRHVSELSARGFNEAFVIPMTVNGKTLYKIMAGRHMNRADAMVQLNKMKQLGYNGFVVVLP